MSEDPNKKFDWINASTKEKNEYLLIGSDKERAQVDRMFESHRFKSLGEQYDYYFGFVDRFEGVLVDLFLKYEQPEATEEFDFDFAPNEYSLTIICNHIVPANYTLSTEFKDEVKKLGFPNIDFSYKDKDGNHYTNGVMDYNASTKEYFNGFTWRKM